MCQQTHSPFTYFKLLIGISSIRLSVCPTIYMSVSPSVRLSRYIFRTQTRRNLLRYFVCRHSLQSKSTMGIINNRWMDDMFSNLLIRYLSCTTNAHCLYYTDVQVDAGEIGHIGARSKTKTGWLFG